MTTLDAYARFLTARWDEQEAISRWPKGCAVVLHGPTSCDCNGRPYVLDDLAAKRAILEDIGPLFDEPDGLGSLVEGVLANLAAPFRDHPDHPANQEAT